MLPELLEGPEIISFFAEAPYAKEVTTVIGYEIRPSQGIYGRRALFAPTLKICTLFADTLMLFNNLIQILKALLWEKSHLMQESGGLFAMLV